MAGNGSSLRPKVGDTDLSVPITIEYSGGRSQSNVSRLLWALLASGFLLIFVIVTLFSDRSIFVRLILIVVVGYLGSAAIRFLILRESRYRNEMMDRSENDYQIKMTNFWGIYKISENDFCYFRNDWMGLYVMLDKGPTVGNTAEDKFNHYEAIADGYNIMGTSRLRVCHIDLMDFIGHDNRIKVAFNKLVDYPNEDTRDLLTSMFQHLQQLAEESFTSYDIYLFMYKGDEIEFENEVTKVLDCFLDGNYVNYTILDRKQIQQIVLSLFNIHDFSVTEATRDAFTSEAFDNSFVPIAITKDGERTVLNKTMKEKKALKQENTRSEKLVKAEMERRKKLEKDEKRKRMLGTVKSVVKRDSGSDEEFVSLDEDVLFNMDESTGMFASDSDDEFTAANMDNPWGGSDAVALLNDIAAGKAVSEEEKRSVGVRKGIVKPEQSKLLFSLDDEDEDEVDPVPAAVVDDFDPWA